MYNKNSLQRVTVLFGICALAALCSACNNDVQVPEQDGKARVSIVIADSQPRTVFPHADIAKYKLLGGNNGAAETEQAEFTAGGTSVFLAPGNWNFTLNAYNAGNTLVLQGKVQDKTINASGTNAVSFNLLPLNGGTGTVQITIQFPVSANITKITASGSIETKDFGITSGSEEFVYTKTAVAAGDYFVSFKLYSGDIPRSVVSEMVLVRSNLTSKKTITLTGEDLKADHLPVIDIAAIAGIAPKAGAVPATTIAETAQYTGTVSWSPNNNPFIFDTVYTATITLTAKTGFTLQGVPANFFTVAGTTAVSNAANSGVITAVFLPAAVVINSVAELQSYLSAKPANTAAAPYAIVLNADNFTDIADTLKANSTRYVYLDISDSATASIGNEAFYQCTSLVGVTIGNSVTSIGNSAFRGCNSLASITIPNNVTDIGIWAFLGCTGLTSVIIGNDVSSIEEKTFMNCLGLTNVIIGNKVTSIGDSAFEGCTNLASVIIPDNVTGIGTSAFDTCTSLASVIIGENVTSIGNYAFYQCYNLANVTIGKRVTSIGKGAFYQCTNLTGVTIPNNVTSIGEYAFSGCTKLASVTIPNRVGSIEVGTFGGCSSLTSVIIGNKVASIGERAFILCTSLTSITIPGSVTSIWSNAFSDCTSLKSVTFQGMITNFATPAFIGLGDLRTKYLAGGTGTYTRDSGGSAWTKQ